MFIKKIKNMSAYSYYIDKAAKKEVLLT